MKEGRHCRPSCFCACATMRTKEPGSASPPLSSMTPTQHTHPSPAWLLAALALLAAVLWAPRAVAAEDQFLEPEKAFLFSARAADARHVEVLFKITSGYYMY